LQVVVPLAKEETRSNSGKSFKTAWMKHSMKSMYSWLAPW
jgi:hypothetical protein